ncbi:MAG: leucine-rich repeat domain-containing protein [Ruminococcaceae bacterium]|nr:leucine-rich repeat domain-containing protein [Oscillospiraceae bacterium]
MKSMKRILALLLSVLMLFATMPITAMAETVTGRLGTSNVYYELTDEGVLRLYGTGATPNYPAEAESSPFAGKYVEKVVVEQGITSIGNYIFAECWDIEEVSLPKSLRYVGNVAFGGCSKLKEITFNSNTENFGFAALYNCRSLKSVTFKSNRINCFGLYSGEANSLLGHVEDATIYVNLPMMIEETQDGVTSTVSSYEDAVAKFGQNNNTVYCVNDNAKIKWKNYDGTVLETDENAMQGEIPTYDGATPTKPADDNNAYYFTGWTPQPYAVMGDMSYTATFGSYGKSAYLDQNGEEQEVFARPLTGTETLLSPGWYVVNKNINYSHTLYFTDSVHIILADGKMLTFSNGCDFSALDPTQTDLNPDGYDPMQTQLNFYWQSGKTGTLTMNGQILTWRLNVYGGNITSKVFGYVSNFYDGNLTFKDEAQCMSLNVYGGNVKMESCDASVQFNIYGGNFQCTGTVTTNAPAYVTLGFTKPSDSISIGYLYLEGNKNNYVNQHVKIKDGQKMTDAADRSTVFEGVLPISSDLITVPNINGKTLVPYAHNAITFTPALNGTVTGPSEADFGDEITLAVTPDEDYALDELTVKTADNETIEVVDNKFIMPATAVTVSATFISTKTYTVTWVVDGEVVETDENLPFGATPEYNGAVPHKAPTAQFTYTFEGWSPAITPVASDVTYTAQFGVSINTYHVRWVVEGETVETDSDVPYGATPEYNGATPQKAATAQFTYAFSGWSPEISPVTGDVTYTAQFTEVTNTYTVSWVVGGETVETDTNIPYGATPEYNGATQDDYYDADHHYIFRGWSDGTSIYASHALPSVNADTVYTAVYTEAAHRFGEPVWEWANDGSSAVAHFTCTDCGYAVSVNASVLEQKQNLISIFSATAHFADADYQNQKTVTRSCNLWISGTQVNGDNASDVFGDGSVSYDEMTNTLTLTDATLEVSRYNDDGAFAIRYNDSYALPLTIVLNGTNSIVDEAADNNVQAKYGVCAFASSPGYVVEGNGTLSISMSAEDDNIQYYGIHMRKPITVNAATVNIAIHGNAPATGVDLCYNDTVLSLTNGAAMNISTGANENSYALNSNRNVENLRVDDGCTLVACSQGTAFGNDIILSDATKALGAYVNAAAQSDGAVKWDASTDLTAYRYVKIPYVKGEHPEDGYSLTIDDSVKVNFYIDMPYYEAEGGYIEYTCIDSINEESARRKTVVAMDDSEEFSAQENGTRKLTLKAAPAQLAEKYEITVYDAQGVEKKRFEASMADYCEQLKNHERYGELCRALLNYGQHSNIFFDYASKHEDVYTVPTAEGFDADLTAGEKSTLAGKAVSSITPGDTAVKGVSYVALMDPELRFYLDASVSESQAAKTPVSITGTADGFAPQAEMVKTDSGICVRVTGLKANDFGKSFNLRIGTTEITYNGYAYLNAVITRTNPTGAQADLYNLAKSVYRYAVAAENTF